MKTIRPLHNGIIFKFEDDVVDGKFKETTNWGFELGTDINSTTKEARWGIVLATGPEIEDPGIVNGARILIEPLAWTEGFQLGEFKVWKTDESKVMAIDES